MAACEDCFDTGVNPWTNEECDSCDFSKPKRPRNKHLNYGKEHIALLTDLFAKGDSSDEVIIKNTQPANWITPQGVWKKQKEIEPRMPNIRFARFITLTIDQSKYLDPEHAFEVGRRHLRQFFYDLDKGLGNAERTPYCWKLEFQENGWPHWHIILLHYKKLPLDLLNKCWGKGRTDVEMIRDTDFMETQKKRFDENQSVFEEDGCSMINPYFINQWFKEYRNQYKLIYPMNKIHFS